MKHLKKIRLRTQKTQKQLAEYLGISRTTYVKYESGKSEPNFENLQKLATYFNVTTDYLLGYKENYNWDYDKITKIIEHTLSGTNLIDENGKLNEQGLQAILEVIENNKEMLQSRVKDLENKSKR